MTNPETLIGERLEAMRVWLLGGFRVSVGARTIEDGGWRLRASASRLWSARRSSLPAVVGPAPPDEPSHGYDHPGECEPKVDDSILPLGTPHQLLVRVGPRIRAFYHPTLRCCQRSRLAFLGDHGDKATTP